MLRKIFTSIFLLMLIASCAPQIKSPQEAQPNPILSPTEGLTIVPQIVPSSTQTPVAVTSTVSAPTSAPKPTRGPKGPASQGGSDAMQNMDFDIPAHPYDVILGRPTTDSITLSLLSVTNQTLIIAYGTKNAVAQTTSSALAANSPTEIQLSNLQPDTQYFYTINGGNENTFHTARPAGSTFTFTIQADSHLDSNSSLLAYQQTLANQRADHPDFVIDMGDTFMTDKYKPYTDAAPQYLSQRYFLGQLADIAPLFLVLGNHDGEGAPRGKDGEEMSIWSAQLRTKYFPNPEPNSFYTGNTTPNPNVGNLQDYYAFTWGDALFIALDPYWYTPSLRNDSSLWTYTLGETQYRWLKSTLETSDAKWKFVFIHQLIGGADKNGRGGVEVAPFYEWGGRNPDGSYAFDQYRPGWDMPIHQLLVANHVNAVFHGHDHLFVKQELDGIIYQEIPQPSSARANGTDSAAEYGYVKGDILGGPGHLRVTVSSEQVTVDYVRSYVEEKTDQQNGQVDYSYAIK